jgi:acyl-CoA reductase-like NAD-dependent aldehyde dehydrogenase
VVNIVTGDEVAGSALVADPRVDKVAFTGSTDAGKMIVKSAADTIKRTTMELGGVARDGSRDRRGLDPCQSSPR